MQTLRNSKQRIRSFRPNRKKNRPYSPDLVSDFYLIGPLTAVLRGGLSSDDGAELKHRMRAYFGSVSKEFCATNIKRNTQREKKCVGSVGEF